MKPIIALCGNVPALDAGGFRDPAVCATARGSEFCPYLVEYAPQQGREVLSGSEALRAVREHRIDARQIAVVQEEENGNGLALVAAGADPAVLLCMESPLFSPVFYDHLPHWRRVWRRQLLFSGGTDHLHFPSFDADAPSDLGPAWDARKPVAAVVAHKHCAPLRERFGSSPTWRTAFRSQLHDERFRLFDDLRRRGLLDLYGHGWPPDSGVRPVADKIATLKQHRYTLVVENVEWPGYVTEKVFDALAAGTVPLYRGPADAGRYLPPEAVVPVGTDPDALALHDFDRWAERRRAGGAFLRSAAGLRHSWQGFARDLLGLSG